MTEVRWDILANLGQNALSSYEAARKRQLEDLQFAAGGRLADIALQNLGGGTTAPTAVAPVAPVAAPKAPSFAGGGARMVAPADPAIEGRFIDTLRSGGLTNPYGLAALAAYANAESAYSPKNITGSWSDPSQSGQPGTSGGILSWRGSRLNNMRNATQGATDPVVAQAQFALTENPDLTVALQNAKTPEEANQVLANAWRFAGYDQPGTGEHQRRLEATRSYLPRVGGNAPTQVAAADLPASGAQPTEFMIPPGTAGAPAASAPAAAPAAAGGEPAAVQQIRTMLSDPNYYVRQQGVELAKKYTQGQVDFQVVGDQAYWVDKLRRTATPVGLQKPSTFQQEYEFAVSRGFKGTPDQWKKAGSPSVNIDQKGETAFATTANTAIAKRFEKVSEEGDTGRADLAALAQIRALGGAIDQNSLPAMRARLADYGIRVGDDIGAIQAFESLVDKMVPQQRIPGAGATSDFDARTFKSSLPRLMNTPEGNALITGTLEALAQDKMARAAVAEKALTGELKPAEAIRELRALPNPDLAFKSGLSELGKAGKLPAQGKASQAGAPTAQAPTQFTRGDKAVNPQTGEERVYDGKSWVVSKPAPARPDL